MSTPSAASGSPIVTAALERLRLVAKIEGVSFLILLGVAMPLKYAAGLPIAVKIVGWAHGVLFILFVLALWGARRDFPEKEAKLKEGHVFILKPACKEGFMRDSIRAGDTVAIEANGARRLGKRELTFVSV